MCPCVWLPLGTALGGSSGNEGAVVWNGLVVLLPALLPAFVSKAAPASGAAHFISGGPSRPSQRDLARWCMRWRTGCGFSARVVRRHPAVSLRYSLSSKGGLGCEVRESVCSPLTEPPLVACISSLVYLAAGNSDAATSGRTRANAGKRGTSALVISKYLN